MPAEMTYPEFLRWAGDDTHAEWVDGKVVPMSPVSDVHADVKGFLLALIRHFVEAGRLGVVRDEPFQMKTGPRLPGRSPDVAFVSARRRRQMKATYLAGPADLVVEIISPESRTRDRGEKFFEYEKGGVREYWLVDPERRQAEFHRLGSRGAYQPIPVGSDGVFRSVVLKGLWLKVDWLWKRPPLMTVLRAWKLV